MYTDIKTGIYNKCTAASDFNTAISGRFFYYFNKNQNPTFPFAVYSIITNEHDYSFSPGTITSANFEEFTVQFDIYSKGSSSNGGPAESETIMGYLKTLLDHGSITVTGYTCKEITRDFALPAVWDQDSQVWSAAAQYKILLQKN